MRPSCCVSAEFQTAEVYLGLRAHSSGLRLGRDRTSRWLVSVRLQASRSGSETLLLVLLEQQQHRFHSNTNRDNSSRALTPPLHSQL
ncbi:hypothetical protein FQA47_020285 [Oryzias melastigma]|uniref:Uncharacterized protein n=1 Tax=Oryzias melastigma TaxID=30732 RepID=A0A834FKN3_ORYME|nr:hypothetical protein FQA47_020285 [Oryzias melastigma]